MISDAGRTRQGRRLEPLRILTALPRPYHPRMRLTVNGRARQLDVAPDATLLSVLRDQLHLTGAKPACERGECGACTVLVDDRTARPSRSTRASRSRTRTTDDSITTIEGLANGSGPASRAGGVRGARRRAVRLLHARAGARRRRAARPRRRPVGRGDRARDERQSLPVRDLSEDRARDSERRGRRCEGHEWRLIRSTRPMRRAS